MYNTYLICKLISITLKNNNVHVNSNVLFATLTTSPKLKGRGHDCLPSLQRAYLKITVKTFCILIS